MNNERKPQQLPHSLEQVTTFVREIALKEDGLDAFLIVDGAQRSVGIVLDDLAENPGESADKMLAVGAQLARRQDVGTLEQLFFVCQARMSLAPLGQSLEIPPSVDSIARDVMVIANLTVADDQLRTIILEMIRDPAGRLVELQTFGDGDRDHTAASLLLIALADGYTAASDQPL